MAKKYSNIIEIKDKNIPKINAWLLVILPVGIGLKHVLLIRASKSDSYHIFKVPAAPAPIATAINEIAVFKKFAWYGAIRIPTIQVNKTKDITLGFIKLKNDSRLKADVIFKFFDLIADCINLFYFR